MDQQPDNTAIRTALWRAFHTQADAEPHILEDTVGLQLIAPEQGWQERPDIKYTQRLRASVVARSRYIEDIITTEIPKGTDQYVILGSGLDTFAQRNPNITSKIQIFEIDQPDTLAWKQKRLSETGFHIPENLHFVPVNFEKSSWWEQLLKAGFNIHKPAVIACTGVTLYLTRSAIKETLQHMVSLAAGSVVTISFYLPVELLEKEDQPMQEMANKGAQQAGTPFISFFSPEEVIAIAKESGLKNTDLVSTEDIKDLYFKNRTDGLSPASGEVFLLARI
ncbi:class I SAM-dependent methyltransferase [Elizabethkingia miricola]|uniref:S-adenosyl-L-methionine-dependent methyltransferase n=1 Tax=Elizabethkingia miricola TaxID=172045 RepID=A0ABY3NJB1_ELIMR|nr:class I SAM-dependent methyltransferase [Elizabethkingia miricola]TYO92862.1 methyltransferase (TIGR00027 family) [Elizabethkingia miricola]UIO95287.1 class I SAM-dependent methyltransferase [Elizabethkingia miricola]WER12083.1 class I SAM-dependent methyltransferase [Elizabethkingia miricola]WGL72260.1 class I SAM-dependent methyltransferase [Elizabethkingia miricola]WNG64055.1 class I SAM-dependent methyltransferase [Elizabethkingia miricola]